MSPFFQIERKIHAAIVFLRCIWYLNNKKEREQKRLDRGCKYAVS